MAKLLAPSREVRQALEACIQAGNDLTAKAEIVEKAGGHCDWLELVAAWRKDSRSTQSFL
jgi:hypothetical protein